MVNWVEVTDENELMGWDEILRTADDYSIFQSIAWGEYKRDLGWQPVRYWVRNKNNKVIAMTQLLIKKLPTGIKLFWASGGPVFLLPGGTIKKLPELLDNLLDEIKLKYPRCVVRFNSLIPNTAILSYNINKVLMRPIYKLSSGYTVLMDMGLTVDELRSRMTSKHRYYAKKASGNSLTWSSGNSIRHIQELADIYQDMMEEKDLSSVATSYDAILHLCNKLTENILVLTGYLNGVAVTSCLVLLFGQKSYYLYAATTKGGREISASYAMFEKLASELNKYKVTQFDFGCIDPENPSAAGVDHFKNGFGGQIQQYLGEWEFASSTLLRFGVNMAIKLRGGKE